MLGDIMLTLGHYEACTILHNVVLANDLGGSHL